MKVRRNIQPEFLFRYASIACVTLLVFTSGCSRPDAPWCLMRAGDWKTDTLTWNAPSSFALAVNDHLQVECIIGTSNEVQLVWSGPANLLAHTSAVWSGSELVLNHEDRCQWARNLSHVVHAKITAPQYDIVQLNGQGNFNLNYSNPTQDLEVDAQDYAGTIDLELALDSATVKLHNGAAQALVTGNVRTFQGYSSGLSSLDASAFTADYAFIHQSGVSSLSFKATEYAYVIIDASGDAMGGYNQPVYWQFNQLGSGQLYWHY